MAINLNNAISNNNYDEVKAYLHNSKLDHFSLEIKDACRDAILLGHKQIVQLFLDEGLNPNAYAHEKGTNGGLCSLSYFAGLIGDLAIMQLLVSKGLQIADRVSDDRRDNQDAMRGAVSGGHTHVVEYLLKNGASADGSSRSYYSRTYLGKVSSREGQKELTELLIAHGAEIKRAIALNNKKFQERFKAYENALMDRYSESAREMTRTYSSDTALQDWDNKKQTLITERDACLQKYTRSIQILLDHAMGTNFDPERSGYSFQRYGGLLFLKGLDISGFNFVGVSVDGEPVTREMLQALELKGADQALVTLNDIEAISDLERKRALLARIEAKYASQGRIVSDAGIVNLIPLAVAAAKGKTDIVCTRLAAGVDPNEKEDSHDLAIVVAASNGFHDIVTRLAEHPKIDSKSRLTAAHAAKKNKHLATAEYLSLLQDVNEKDHNGNAAIHNAVKERDIDEIARLLQRGADINLENSEGQTPLAIAACNVGSIEWGLKASEKAVRLIEFLLKHKADPNQYRWQSPLQSAARCGSLEAMRLLLPVTNLKDEIQTDLFGRTKGTIPWYVSLMFDSYGSEEWLSILALLKEHKADINALSKNGATVLSRCIYGFPSFTHIRSTLRDLQRSISGCEQRLGPTPLQNDYNNLVKEAHSRFEEKFEQLRALLQMGASPQILFGESKRSVLHLFIEKIDVRFIEGATERVIELFLQYGLDVNVADEDGCTPLHSAAHSGDEQAAAYLIKKGATVNARNKRALTPLHLAAAGAPNTTKLLLEKGADVKALDQDGLSPLAYSEKQCIDNNKTYTHPSKEREKPYRKAQRLISLASQK